VHCHIPKYFKFEFAKMTKKMSKGGGGDLIIVLHNSFEDIVEHKWI